MLLKLIFFLAETRTILIWQNRTLSHIIYQLNKVYQKLNLKKLWKNLMSCSRKEIRIYLMSSNNTISLCSYFLYEIGDVLQEYYHPNIKEVSNLTDFDENKAFKGQGGELIHLFNKNRIFQSTKRQQQLNAFGRLPSRLTSEGANIEYIQKLAI